MKKLLQFSIASLAVMFVMTGTGLKAQTAITIQYAGDSTWTAYCPVPIVADFYIYGTSTGYALGDSVNIHVYFGDGSDSSFYSLIYQTSYFSTGFQHLYQYSGLYDCEYIVTGSDGNADTLINYDEVLLGDSCGNVSGMVYVDVDASNTFNTGDLAVPGCPVQLLQGANVVAWAYTDATGAYYFSVPTGFTYTIQIPGITQYGYTVTSPVSGSYTVSSLPSANNDFGTTCMGGFDLEAYLWTGNFRPGFNRYIYVDAYNTHCLPTSGTATLTLDSRLTYVSSNLAPTSVAGNVITWNFSNLNNVNYWYWYNAWYTWVEVAVSPSAVIGDSLCNTFSVDPIVGDFDATNNTSTVCRVFTNAIDPNEKTREEGVGATGRILPTTTLDYTIHFQNTGTDTAYNVFILDTLDTHLDLNTFQVVSSSSQVTVDILPGRVVKFGFYNIMLPDSGANQARSNGYVAYRVKPNTGVANGSIINNVAGIYFDFNSAVVTNTTLNTIDVFLSTPSIYMENDVMNLYPNPAVRELAIEVHGNTGTTDFTVVDMLGNEVMKGNFTGNLYRVNVSQLANGVYTVKATNSTSVKTSKITITH